MVAPWATMAMVSGVALLAVSAKAPKNIDKQVIKAMPKDVAKPKSERKVLIFASTNGYKHPSIPTGKIALELLGKHTKAYTSVISDDLKNFEKGTIEQYDTIVFLNTTQSVFRPAKVKFLALSEDEQKSALAKEKQLQANLMEFIKGGKGFVGIHAATDTYHDWPEFGDMIGAYFDGHPWRHNTKVSIKVEDGKKDHPLVAHMKGRPLNFKEEIYQFKAPYDSSKLNMLLRLDTKASDMKVKGIKRKDNDFGVSWTKKHGEGRVFYSALGHNHEIYWNDKVLAHFLAGMQWALGDIEAEGAVE